MMKRREEVFELRARVYYEGGIPTQLTQDRLLIYFIENKIKDGDLVHVPMSKVAIMKESWQQKFKRANIATPKDIKEGKNKTFVIRYPEWGMNIFIECWIVNIRNARPDRECKKTV